MATAAADMSKRGDSTFTEVVHVHTDYHQTSCTMTKLLFVCVCACVPNVLQHIHSAVSIDIYSQRVR